MTGGARRALVTVALAAAIHVAAVGSVPLLVMHRAMDVLHAEAGVGANAAYHAPRVDARTRQVTKPSPDMLYSVCAYDVTRHPLHVTAQVPDTYFSLSLFAIDTDVFFVVNDRDLGPRGIDVLVVGEDWRGVAPAGSQVVVAPSARGVVLFRALVDDERALPAIDSVRRTASCDEIHQF